MVDRSDVESAIMDAQGAAAVLSILEDQLEASTQQGWLIRDLKPRDDLSVMVLSPTERRALDHASQSLQNAVAEIARVFYAKTEPMARPHTAA